MDKYTRYADRFTRHRKVERYRRLLTTAPNEEQRDYLRVLVAEEQQKQKIAGDSKVPVLRKCGRLSWRPHSRPSKRRSRVRVSPRQILTRAGRQVGEELARVFLARRRRLPPKKLGEMKPGKRPPASPSNDGRLLDGTLGSDPVHQDRPHHVGQTLWILDGAALIQKAD